MSVLSRLKTYWPSKSADNNPTLELFREIYGWGRTVNGVHVTLELALRTSVFLDCGRIISEGCAQVPFRLKQEQANGDCVIAVGDNLDFLVNRKPNAIQTSFGYREMLVMHAACTGNGYALKAGNIVDPSELIPLDPTRCHVYRETNGDLKYNVTLYDSTSRTFGPEQMIHLRGPSWLQHIGMDVIKLAAAAIGLASTLEQGQSEFAKSGLKPAGIYSVDGALDEKQYKQVLGFLKMQKAGDPFILDRNAKWLQQTATAVDSQLIESRKFQIEDVCRVMRVMPIMVGYSDKTATYASAEQMFLAHLVHTLTPWYERVEQTHDTQILSDRRMKQGYRFELDEQMMLRGALKDTADYLQKLTGGGIVTRNEARRRLNLNRIEGLDEPLIPTTSPPESLMPDPDAATEGTPTDAGDPPPTSNTED